jgi:AbrB family looped-hinge helix DNA binding protein
MALAIIECKYYYYILVSLLNERKDKKEMYYSTMSKRTRSNSRVTQKGQVTIPKEIRDSLGIGEGSVLHFFADGERIIGVKINDDLESVYGAVEHKKGPIDFEELRERTKGAVAKQVVEDLEENR